MISRKDEFTRLVGAQLEVLHRRIEELAALTNEPHEHAISYETVISEARRKHEETMRRLRSIDARADAWPAKGEAVRAAVRELTAAVERGEKLRS